MSDDDDTPRDQPSTWPPVATTGVVAAVTLACAYAAGALWHSDLLTQATLQNLPMVIHALPHLLPAIVATAASLIGGAAHCIRTHLHLKGRK